MADEEISAITIDDCVNGIVRMISKRYKTNEETIPGLPVRELKRVPSDGSSYGHDAATVRYILTFFDGEILDAYTIEIINPEKKGGEMIKVKFMRVVGDDQLHLPARYEMIKRGNQVYIDMKGVKGDPIPQSSLDFVIEKYELEFTLLDYKGYLLESQAAGSNPQTTSSPDDPTAKSPKSRTIDNILTELKKIYGLQDLQEDTENKDGYSCEIDFRQESTLEISEKVLLTIKLDRMAVETYLILCTRDEIGVVSEGRKAAGDLPLKKKNDLLWKSYRAAEYLRINSKNNCSGKLPELIITRTPKDMIGINSQISRHHYIIPKSGVLTKN